jgi:hypothetical protein
MNAPPIDRTVTQNRRKIRGIMLALLLGLFIVGGVGGFIAGFIDGTSEAANGTTPIADMVGQPNTLFWLIVLLTIVANAIALWAAAKWFYSIDEAAQRAHLESWFWGASIIAMIPTPFAMGALFIDGFEWTVIEAIMLTKTQIAIIGAAAFYFILLLGYSVAWAYWWWKRR